jgi:hypothetical protein
MAIQGREIRDGFGIARFEERKYLRFLLDLLIEYHSNRQEQNWKILGG